MSSEPTPIQRLTQGLPTGYIVRPFAQSIGLDADVDLILSLLRETGDGNQWVLLVALAPETIARLADAEHPWGELGYRFQWDDQIGVLKVVADYSHIITTDHLTRTIDHHLYAVPIAIIGHQWIANTAYQPTPTTGKQADQALLPLSRWANNHPASNCPTLVIETGLQMSLPRLRENAKWWFANSNGNVRIVLVITISVNKVRIEKWQLAPPGAPRPLSCGDFNALHHQNPPPPLVQQFSASQQPYSAQEIEVTSGGVTGAPLVLPYAALFDQAPGPGAADVVLGATELRSVASCMF